MFSRLLSWHCRQRRLACSGESCEKRTIFALSPPPSTCADPGPVAVFASVFASF